MDDLIEALTIFRRYGNPEFPTHCVHDKLIIVGINPSNVLQSDKDRLERLGFFENPEFECFQSYHFGRA